MCYRQGACSCQAILRRHYEVTDCCVIISDFFQGKTGVTEIHPEIISSTIPPARDFIISLIQPVHVQLRLVNDTKLGCVQTAVTAHFSRKWLLQFAFARWNTALQSQQVVSAYF